MIRTLRALPALALLGLAGGLLGASPALAEGDAEAGKQSYQTFCFACHGATGKGDGPAGAALNPKPRDFSTGDFKYDADGDGKPGTDADLALILKNGAAKYGGSAVMTAWSPPLTDAQVADVIAFIRTLKK